MATKIEFKQQCPSCEAMVPIRDRKLIGRKIDCPKCKYRFKVEDPEAEEEEEENGSDAKGKAAPIKGKPGKTRPKGAESGKPGKKAGPNKTTLWLGLGLGLVAVILLGVVGWLLFGPGDDTPPKKGGVKVPVVGRTTNPDKEPDPKASEPTPTTAWSDPTNLLPNDTQRVLSINVSKLMDSALRRVFFDTPGGFSPEGFRQKFGFGLSEIKRLLAAQNETEDWTFYVLTTSRALQGDDLQGRLGKKPGRKSPLQNLDYFELDADLDSLGNFFFAPGKPMAWHLVDDHTLVIAQLAPLEKFLDAKGRPTLLTPPPAPPLSGGPAPAGAEQLAKPDEQPAKPAGDQPAAPPGTTPSYLSINPVLKGVLDQVEEGKDPVILSLATLPSKKAFGQVAKLAGQGTLPVGRQIPDVRAHGLSLGALKTDWAPVVLVDEHKTEENAKKDAQFLREKSAPALVLLLKNVFNMEAVLLDDQGNVPAGIEVPPEVKLSKINVLVKDKSVVYRFELMPPEEALAALVQKLQPSVVYLKGTADLANLRPRLHELAAALKSYTEKNEGQFPRGTVERKPVAERGFLPWRPDKRISWMADLLPYLGHGEYRDLAARIDRDHSWDDPENQLFAYALVPHFLAPGSAEKACWITYPGMSSEVAATHFVAVAGIGLDAASAEVSRADPEAAKRIGVFGYDRVTRLEDIKDGPANTIALLQVPSYFKAPWLAGGGSTVRGVPETDSVRPFVCTQHNGKPGTFAVMADGAVRFIPEDIPDETFKALCTIAGGEAVTNLDAAAPLVPGGTAVLKPMVPPDKPDKPKTPDK